ncbi:Qat anti-phage system QueC-like protein QatC [Bacteroides acidifaciens]|uniref:Qat anti-phage system QueC-like protein QatC n=1 Tax=Bacteroides acidifaciens TaxID=85831 RepID=UPI002617F9D2|nr:Qat anti-phage system QueC-like protein QatC [Bacteroides acidifaciens]
MIEIVVGDIRIDSSEQKNQKIYLMRIPLLFKGAINMRTYAEIDISEICQFKDLVPNALFDMLIMSGIVYSVDRTISRKRFSINGLTREMIINLPTSNLTLWNPLTKSMNELLSFMTGDLWSVKFRPTNNYDLPSIPLSEKCKEVTAVSLFSGGMDSLIGAIDLAQIESGKIFLASHYDSTMGGPKGDQEKVFKMLNECYPDKFIRFKKAVRIQPQKHKNSELSSRSRSLMFFAIAAIVAEALGTDIVIPENGSVSLNYPLSDSRRSACSTRTTHPILVNQFNNLLLCLGVKTRANNPYEFQTKGEMVQGCKDPSTLIKIVPQSNSCGKRSQHQFMLDNHFASHCGRCMPCMYRRASLLGYDDLTTYGIEPLTLYHNRKGKLSNDFFAMLNFLRKDLNKKDIAEELKIIGFGNFPDLEQYVELVVRTRKELKSLLVNKGMKDFLLNTN